MDQDDEIPGGIQKADPLEHVGFEAQRVIFGQSPMDILERIIAFRWMEANNQEWCILDRLVSNQDDGHGATQRDAEVAATVIQWLGTAVGYSFLVRCLEEAGFKIEPPR
ncbi:MAG: hypothetical protein A3G05_00175 [Candidatus Zambryskibacteria bacterium RIFCSPLOWO2_12_FULL_45_14]|uniref:Uncharacterized protein n=1 Tax=Candidatus Zambryskibacteria bacterium RIFCSPLOWO2_12_FULL_45_14 TaxID=1802778 RepID=A0A1G2UYA9_9BACT|nr:MAG: hypothetical protein A3G05_00175 [Candidatus Zambryskibacteria bacterium RIFCSPLOWO2_12_FULL_45_14]